MTIKKTEHNASAETKPEKRKRFDHDGLWKDLVKRFFYPLLKRALPELYEAADRSKEPEFLDKEFTDILNTADPKIHSSPYFADYVAKVPLKNGEVEFIILHVELQGKGGGNLAVRMYHYKSLIFAHYQKEPVALAIITDKRPEAEEAYYSHSHFGTESVYRYNILMLAKLDDDELIKSDNPIDLAFYAAKCALLAKEELQKYNYLRTLTGLLAERGWSMDDKRDLLLFLERFMNLKDNQLKDQIREYQCQLDKEGKVMYISIAEEYYTAKGRQEGIEKGKEEMARNLMASGIAPDLIAQSSGLPIEQILRLIY
jgi:predicted transposase YdaD